MQEGKQGREVGRGRGRGRGNREECREGGREGKERARTRACIQVFECARASSSEAVCLCVCKSHSCNSFLSEINKDLHRRVRHKDLHQCVRLCAAPAQMSQVPAQLSPPLLPFSAAKAPSIAQSDSLRGLSRGIKQRSSRREGTDTIKREPSSARPRNPFKAKQNSACKRLTLQTHVRTIIQNTPSLTHVPLVAAIIDVYAYSHGFSRWIKTAKPSPHHSNKHCKANHEAFHPLPYTLQS